MFFDVIWAPYFFVSQENWAQRNMGPKKIGFCKKMPYNDFHAETKFLGTKFLWIDISRGLNFLGQKKIKGPNEIRDHFSISH